MADYDNNVRMPGEDDPFITSLSPSHEDHLSQLAFDNTHHYLSNDQMSRILLQRDSFVSWRLKNTVSLSFLDLSVMFKMGSDSCSLDSQDRRRSLRHGGKGGYHDTLFSLSGACSMPL